MFETSRVSQALYNKVPGYLVDLDKGQACWSTHSNNVGQRLPCLLRSFRQYASLRCKPALVWIFSDKMLFDDGRSRASPQITATLTDALQRASSGLVLIGESLRANQQPLHCSITPLARCVLRDLE